MSATAAERNAVPFGRLAAVGAGDRREPLLHGRGRLLIDDFCDSTGLDPSAVQALIEDGVLQGVFHTDGRVAGLLDDALPSADELRARGLTVSSDYDPDQLRSDEVDEDESDQVEQYVARSTWTLPEKRASD